MQHVADFSRHLQRLAHVHLLELELLILRQMAQIALRAGNEIVHRQHVPPFGEQLVAKMRPQKPSPARHHCTHANSSKKSIGQCSVSALEHPNVLTSGTGPVSDNPPLRPCVPSTTSFPVTAMKNAGRPETPLNFAPEVPDSTQSIFASLNVNNRLSLVSQ